MFSHAQISKILRCKVLDGEQGRIRFYMQQRSHQHISPCDIVTVSGKFWRWTAAPGQEWTYATSSTTTPNPPSNHWGRPDMSGKRSEPTVKILWTIWMCHLWCEQHLLEARWPPPVWPGGEMASLREDLGIALWCACSSHSSDLKIGTLVATLPGVWHYSQCLNWLLACECTVTVTSCSSSAFQAISLGFTIFDEIFAHVT